MLNILPGRPLMTTFGSHPVMLTPWLRIGDFMRFLTWESFTSSKGHQVQVTSRIWHCEYAARFQVRVKFCNEIIAPVRVARLPYRKDATNGAPGLTGHKKLRTGLLPPSFLRNKSRPTTATRDASMGGRTDLQAAFECLEKSDSREEACRSSGVWRYKDKQRAMASNLEGWPRT